MRVLRFYLAAITVVWLGVLLGAVIPALATGTLSITEAGTAPGRWLAGAVLTLPGTLGGAIVLSWWCFWRGWRRWAFYGSLLPVLNVVVAGVAWVWDVQTSS